MERALRSVLLEAGAYRIFLGYHQVIGSIVEEVDKLEIRFKGSEGHKGRGRRKYQ